MLQAIVMASRFFDGSCKAKAIGAKSRLIGSLTTNPVRALAKSTAIRRKYRAAASGASDTATAWVPADTPKDIGKGSDRSIVRKCADNPIVNLETACGVSVVHQSWAVDGSSRGTFREGVVKGIRFVASGDDLVKFPLEKRICFNDFPCENHNDPQWRNAVVDWLLLVGKPILVHSHPQHRSNRQRSFLSVCFESTPKYWAVKEHLSVFHGIEVKAEVPDVTKRLAKKRLTPDRRTRKEQEIAQIPRFIGSGLSRNAYFKWRNNWRKKHQWERFVQRNQKFETG